MIHRIKSCFHTEKTNLGRQTELDVARGFSVICMVLTHTYSYYSSWTENWAKSFFDIVCGGPLAAAVFMFCMGINLSYSKRNQPKDFIRRGFYLLGIGLLLSVLRSLVPDMLYYYFEGSTTFIEDLPYLLQYMLSKVDIFQFAGLFHIAFGLMKQAKLSDRKILLLAVLFLIIGSIFIDFSTESTELDILLGFFILTHGRVFFPFLNWFIIPVSGYLFGQIWLRCRDKETFYRTITPVSWILALLYLAFSRGYHYLDYYYALRPVEALFALITAFAMLGTGYFVSRHCKKLTGAMCWLSREITAMYCVHWVLIPNLYVLVTNLISDSLFPLADIWIAPLGFLMLALSCMLIAFYRSITQRKRLLRHSV